MVQIGVQISYRHSRESGNPVKQPMEAEGIGVRASMETNAAQTGLEPVTLGFEARVSILLIDSIHVNNIECVYQY